MLEILDPRSLFVQTQTITFRESYFKRIKEDSDIWIKINFHILRRRFVPSSKRTRRARHDSSFFLHEIAEDMFYVHHGQRGMNPGMRFPVADQARLLRERLAANITDIRSFARVDKQMLPVRGATCEGLAAYVTVVWSVTGMGHHVLFQPMVLRERFPAFLADETLPSLVLQQDVLVEILLGDHAPLADLALVLWLEMRPLLMHVQGVAVRASFPAHVAHDRPFFVLEPYVQPHVTLHLELLAAILAVVLVLRRVFPLQVFLQSAPVLALELAHVARILLRLRCC